MMDLLNIYNHLDIFVLILLRISGFVFVSPLIGRKEVPSITKIGISIYLTYILIIADKPNMQFLPEGIGQYIVICVLETLKGMLLGFLSTIFFSIFATAGQLMDTQIGFHMGGLLDPEYGTKIPLTGNLLNIIAFVIFLKLDGHLQLIYILSESYAANPIGTILVKINIASIFTNAFSLAYLFAVKIALPVILVILFSEVVLGIMIKFIPQMNIFVVGIPIKILAGVFTLFFIITPFVNILNDIFESMFKFTSQLF